jgi:hypothetical protein
MDISQFILFLGQEENHRFQMIVECWKVTAIHLTKDKTSSQLIPPINPK